jgi:hypothetical protein
MTDAGHVTTVVDVALVIAKVAEPLLIRWFVSPPKLADAFAVPTKTLPV